MKRHLLVAAAAMIPAPLLAQKAPTTPLGQALARATEPRSHVVTVRELRNGDVMVADPIDKKLLLLPSSLRSARVLGKEGSGPGEYRQPDAVYAFPGDSTLVVDLGNARLSIVGPNGVWTRSIPMAGGPGDGPPAIIIPQATDARGNIYFAPAGGGGRIQDSIPVMRVDSKGNGASAIARLKGPELDRQESGSANQRSVRIRPIPLSASDGWTVTPAGAAMVARAATYRIDIVTNGSTRSGPPLEVTRAKIGAAEKREWVEQQMMNGGISVNVEDDGQARRMSFGRSRPQQEPDVNEYKWPEVKPPFEASSLRVDASGRLWVRRLGAAGTPRLYDVFGADGAHQKTIAFPAGRVLLGFGANALYAAEVDEDGQYFIERYAVPR